MDARSLIQFILLRGHCTGISCDKCPAHVYNICCADRDDGERPKKSKGGLDFESTTWFENYLDILGD